MSIRLISDDRTTAMYDSVTGIAFGEVFEDDDHEEEASAFLEFAYDMGADVRYPDQYAAARGAWVRTIRDEWLAKRAASTCQYCGKPENDEPHSNGVCPSYEKFIAESYGQPALDVVPF